VTWLCGGKCGGKVRGKGRGEEDKSGPGRVEDVRGRRRGGVGEGRVWGMEEYLKTGKESPHRDLVAGRPEWCGGGSEGCTEQKPGSIWEEGCIKEVYERKRGKR
jgi:hypothetical protein